MNERMNVEIRERIERDSTLLYRFITNQIKTRYGLDATKLYWGRIEKKSGKEVETDKAWVVDAGEGELNEINVFSRIKPVYIVGFGETAEEAANEALKEIYAMVHGIGRYKSTKFDFARLTSICPLSTKGSAQCFISAVLYQIDRNYEEGGKYARRKFTTSVFCQN